MRSILAVTAVAAALALSGCLSSSQSPEALAPASAAGHILDFAGCTEQLAILPTPMEEARGVVPEGFEPVAFDPGGAFAIVAGITFSCAGLTGLVQEDGAQEMTGILVVAPPEELRVAGVDTYGIPIGSYTGSQALADLYNGWDIPTSVSAITLTAVDAPMARATVAQGEDDTSAVTIVTAAAVPAPQAAGMARIFGVRDGVVTGAVDFAWTASEGLQGSSVLLFSDGQMPLPFPAPGLGFQYWADDYAYHLEHKPLAMLLAEAGSAAPVNRPFGVAMPQAELPGGGAFAGLV